MSIKRQSLGRLLRYGAGAAGVAWLAPAFAQCATDYPTRSIKIVVPFVPGGATDLLGRLFAERFQRAWGQPVVVENRPGAGAVVGSEFVARSAPDGYTLLLTNTALVQTGALIARLPYDPVKDFAPIAQLTTTPIVFCVSDTIPARTLAEYIALVKANPKRYSYGSAGVGQTLHLYGELMNRVLGVDLAHVPYKGEAAMIGDLAAGQIAGGFSSYATSRPFLQAGKIRPIAVAGPSRIASLPAVPTLRESGYSEFDTLGWFGLFATGGTPAPVVRKISAETLSILKQPDVAARLDELALPVSGIGPEEFARMIDADVKGWATIVRQANIKAE